MSAVEPTHTYLSNGSINMTKDSNGFRIHPGHTGLQGPHIGETVWLLVREQDAKMWGVWPTRHDAVGVLATCRIFQVVNSPEWIEPVPVPVGSVRLDDVIMLDSEPNTEPEDVETPLGE